MSQRSLLPEDDEALPVRRPRHETLDGDPLSLLLEMESVLQFPHSDGRWHARALSAKEYGHGDNPHEAMREALRMRRRERR